jgi:sugar phosphate isomerase/epimerase
MKIALSPMSLDQYRPKPSYGEYINTYKNDIRTMLSNVKKCGFDGIEMGTPEGFSTTEFKEVLDSAGLQAVSGKGLRYPEMAGSDFQSHIDECVTLGTKNVMVSNVPSVALGNQVELNKFIKDLNRVGKIFMEEAGIHVSYHNHAIDFSKISGIPILEQIFENTDERYVFFEPDTYWLQAGGAHVISWIKKLKGRMYMVHFKDYGIDLYSDYTALESTHRVFAEIGEGNLNWPGIIAECKSQGIEWCSVEQDKVQRPAYEAYAQSVKNLRSYGV